MKIAIDSYLIRAEYGKEAAPFLYSMPGDGPPCRGEVVVNVMRGRRVRRVAVRALLFEGNVFGGQEARFIPFYY